MAAYKKENIIVMWLVWHFYQMPKFLLLVWKNYIEFGLDFFSVPLLLATLFSPWRRYQWNLPKGFSVVEFANIFVSNIFSRLIGAICRLVLIVVGVVVLFFILLAGLAGIILWLVLPFICVALILLLFS